MPIGYTINVKNAFKIIKKKDVFHGIADFFPPGKLLVEAGYDTTTSPSKSGRAELQRMKSSSSAPLASKNVTDLRQNPGYTNVDIFTYGEMRLATKLFRPDLILGEGGFGIVYKGVIDSSVRPGYKTTQVAIKELNPEGFQGDREWLV